MLLSNSFLNYLYASQLENLQQGGPQFNSATAQKGFLNIHFISAAWASTTASWASPPWEISRITLTHHLPATRPLIKFQPTHHIPICCLFCPTRLPHSLFPPQSLLHASGCLWLVLSQPARSSSLSGVVERREDGEQDYLWHLRLDTVQMYTTVCQNNWSKLTRRLNVSWEESLLLYLLHKIDCTWKGMFVLLTEARWQHNKINSSLIQKT